MNGIEGVARGFVYLAETIHNAEERFAGRLRPSKYQMQVTVSGEIRMLLPVAPQCFAVVAGPFEIERAQLRLEARCASLDLNHAGELTGTIAPDLC